MTHNNRRHPNLQVPRLLADVLAFARASQSVQIASLGKAGESAPQANLHLPTPVKGPQPRATQRRMETTRRTISRNSSKGKGTPLAQRIRLRNLLLLRLLRILQIRFLMLNLRPTIRAKGRQTKLSPEQSLQIRRRPLARTQTNRPAPEATSRLQRRPVSSPIPAVVVFPAFVRTTPLVSRRS